VAVAISSTSWPIFMAMAAFSLNTSG
jgi:hypothetical protein